MTAIWNRSSPSQYCVRELSLSHSYFSKKFKRETGTGYVTYVTMAKMERARTLMEDPRNRANEIAKQLGYYDYSYFFQNFRRYFGCSPREFKSHGRIPGIESGIESGIKVKAALCSRDVCS